MTKISRFTDWKMSVELAHTNPLIWSWIRGALHPLLTPQDDPCQSLVDAIAKIISIFWKKDPSVIDKKIRGLREMMERLPTDVQTIFFTKTLPSMGEDLINRLPISLSSVPFLSSGISASLSLSEDQCYLLIASSFFCIPLFQDGIPLSLHSSTFFHFFERPSSSQTGKLSCIIEYFNQVASSPKRDRTITISRYTELDTRGTEFWGQSEDLLSNLTVHGDNEGIENDSNFLQADFANRFLGGGVLNRGCVQEEIRFMISPELLVSTFLCDPMGDREAVLMEGSRQFTRYKGYARTFEFSGRNACENESRVLAIDAIPFRVFNEQFRPECVLRELEKCRIGLMSDRDKMPFATGNWGCGAFGGDAQLKSIIQWLAASVCKRDIHYYPFGDFRVSRLFEIVEAAKARKWRVGQVFRALLTAPTGESKMYEYLLNTL